METPLNQRLLLRRLVRVILFCASIFVVTRIALQIGTVANAPTVGFSFLILVLLSAFFGDLVVAIITSIVAALCFNYFFLPPVGTFTIAELDDWISLAAFLLTAVAISRLTSNAHNNFNKASHLDHTLTDLNEFGHWLLSIPHDQLSLSAIAARVVQAFGLPYCSIHVYVEGKWHHFTGAAGTVISPEIAGKLKVIEDHSTNLMELVEEHESGARYLQIKQGDSPLALLVVKGGDALPANALGTLGNMIGVRINEALQNRSSLPVNFSR